MDKRVLRCLVLISDSNSIKRITTMIKINDSRTTVTEVFLEESKYADGTKKFFVAYRVKGNSSARLVNGGSGYSYSFLQKVDEDHVKALAENGDWHTYTIGKDGVWDGLQRGFTEERNATSKGKESGAKSSSGKNADNSSSSNKDGCLMKIIKAPFKLLWWIIKTVLNIVTFGFFNGWFED